MDMSSALQWTQLFANIATIAGVVGVIVAYRQFRSGAIAQKRATAVVAWSEYLRLALQHQQFARPEPYMTGKGIGTPVFSQYRWFVAAMMFAAEQVLDAHDGDKAWEDIVKAQLRYHKGFLHTDFFDPLVYSPVLGRLASEVKREPPIALPPGE
jgi:hypothetical protein